MKININQSNCIDCGLCISLCPEVFVRTDEGEMSVNKVANYNSYINTLKDSELRCPVGAITIE